MIIEQRWSGHQKAIQAVKNNIKQLIESLTEIKNYTGDSLDAEDIALAVGLLNATVKLKFIFLLEFLCHLLGIIEPANQILQQRDTGYRRAMPIIQAVRENILAMRTDVAFNEFMKMTQETLGEFNYESERPIRRRRRSTLLNDSVVMSTIGECDSNDETISLKRIYFEIIDLVSSEMTRRFDQNNDILMAIEAANDFLTDDFDHNKLLPLTELKLTLPPQEELKVAKTYLIRKMKEKDDDSKKKQSILQMLFPVANVFLDTYHLFEAIDTFGSSTSMNESSFSALSRIHTVQRRSMTDQRLRDLSFIAFEKKRLSSLKVDSILRKFDEKNRRVQLF